MFERTEHDLLQDDLLTDEELMGLDLESDFPDDILCLGGCGAWLPADQDLCLTCSREYNGKHDFHREALRRLAC